MVDAEQTYFQPAIDNSIYGLQEMYNSGLDPNSGKHRFTIFGTHQCYLKDAGARLRRDLKGHTRKVTILRQSESHFASLQHIFCWLRSIIALLTNRLAGAYMVSERQRVRVGLQRRSRYAARYA